MKNYILLLIISFLAGCADSHQILRTSPNLLKLDDKSSVYISVPRDGRYGEIDYTGSGATTAQTILLSFSKYVTQVETGHEYQSYKDALEHAKKNSFDYLIFPSILAWEDRATEWSGIPDKASIKIAIIQVSNSKTIDSAIIKGKSGLATFGGDRPQDLLVKPVDDYVKTLFN